MSWTAQTDHWIFFVGDLLRPRGYAIDLPERYIGLDEINAYRDAHPGEDTPLARFVGAAPHVQENIVVPTLARIRFKGDPVDPTPCGLASGAPENLTVPFTRAEPFPTQTGGETFTRVRVPNGSLNRFVNEAWREVGGRLEKKRTVDTDALIVAWYDSTFNRSSGQHSGMHWFPHDIREE